MDQQELKNVLDLHSKWVMGRGDGKRANLSGANLSGANLSRANLSGANLSGANLFEANLSEANLFEANLSEANLARANLSGANLSGANLFEANLSGANLFEANLSEANLFEANLSEANLFEANLSEANLARANLSGANLFEANLSEANLSRANLFEANLSEANLSEANLSGIKADFFKTLEIAKAEVLGLYDALMKGKIEGSQYEGDCACLVGTVAKLRKENYKALTISLSPDAAAPAERWFMGIKEGDIPQSNPVAAVTSDWMREFMDKNGIEYPTYEIVAVTKGKTMNDDSHQDEIEKP